MSVLSDRFEENQEAPQQKYRRVSNNFPLKHRSPIDGKFHLRSLYDSCKSITTSSLSQLNF